MTDNNYDDIINLPHHVSKTHSRMSARSRAVQFSPFAALTGYDAEINETARLTNEKLTLDEDRAAELDARLQILIDNAQECPNVSITFFKADKRKSGGAYVTINGNFRRVDESDNTMIFTDSTKISIADIYAIEGEIFSIIKTDK